MDRITRERYITPTEYMREALYAYLDKERDQPPRETTAAHEPREVKSSE